MLERRKVILSRLERPAHGIFRKLNKARHNALHLSQGNPDRLGKHKYKYRTESSLEEKEFSAVGKKLNRT